MPEPEPNPELNPAGVTVRPLASSPVLVPGTDGPKGHISPACCCVPCDPPVVDCHIEVTYAGAVVVWTAERSAQTWIIEQCSSGARTRFDLTGTSGEIPFNSDCSYTIYGVNNCGQATHVCEQCDIPSCEITLAVDSTDGDDRQTLRWNVSRMVGESPIVRITVDGVDEPTPDPLLTSYEGTIEVLCQGNPDTEVCVEAENECGQIVECCYTIPCLWKKDILVVECSGFLSNYSYLLSGGAHPDPNYDYSEYDLNGLDAINGTHFDAPDDCDWPVFSAETAASIDGWYEKRVLQLGVYYRYRWDFTADAFRFYTNIADGSRCLGVSVRVSYERFRAFNPDGSVSLDIDSYPAGEPAWRGVANEIPCDASKEICESVPSLEDLSVAFPSLSVGGGFGGPPTEDCFGVYGGGVCTRPTASGRFYLDV